MSQTVYSCEICNCFIFDKDNNCVNCNEKIKFIDKYEETKRVFKLTYVGFGSYNTDDFNLKKHFEIEGKSFLKHEDVLSLMNVSK